MWEDLPKSLNSHFGFQGCLSSLELNGEMIDPLKVGKLFSLLLTLFVLFYCRAMNLISIDLLLIKG